MEILTVAKVGNLEISVQKSKLPPHFIVSSVGGIFLRVKMPHYLEEGEDLCILSSNTKDKKYDIQKLIPIKKWLEKQNLDFPAYENITAIYFIWKLMNKRKK